MTNLSTKDFDAFFEDLWSHKPFPWQSRLVQHVAEKGWPKYLDLPTASGKTAALDIAVFTLAMQAELLLEQRTVGRRIFFVVNRRVIVDEAFERANKMAAKLSQAPNGTMLHRVAQGLKRVSGDDNAPPLDVALLRGGIARDNRWARSLTQPTIITSTIDQVGSRLLFRGYGVSDSMRPLHAALIAHDSLLLLDEAHISQPFVETINAVRDFQSHRWSKAPVSNPFAFVQMTATPGEDTSESFSLDEDDREDSELTKRHACPKPVTLEVAKGAKGKNPHPILAKALVAKAIELLDDDRKNIAIVVNRVATARLVAELLPEALRKAKLPSSDVFLAIGRMRPMDRDQLTGEIKRRVGRDFNFGEESLPMFVVATQCLEVGADFDFDALVSECASIDALRQRFGRLNRRGRPIKARGAIVVREDQQDIGDDPIYGTAIGTTWQWLKEHAADVDNGVDFGIRALDAVLNGAETAPMLAPKPHAPVMFPAYVDAWAQTNPAPLPDPDVALFIHGPQRGEPDVQVCWREDLTEENWKHWRDIVGLLPPTSPECMSVPIGIVRAWLDGRKGDDSERSDLLDGMTAEQETEVDRKRRAVLWRGLRESNSTAGGKELKPGDTVVLPAEFESWNHFGHIPKNTAIDIAEEARFQSAGIVTLRLRPEDLKVWPKSEERDALLDWIADDEQSLRDRDLRRLFVALSQNAPDSCVRVREAMALLSGAKGKLGFDYERYPTGKAVVFRAKRPVRRATIIPAMDDGDDQTSALSLPVELPGHLRHVAEALESSLELLYVAPHAEALRTAAALHDWGKVDERFQAMLLRGNIHAARAREVPLAKSGGMPVSRQEWLQAAVRCGYPQGFRHEMLSMQLAEKADGQLPADPILRDLTLHLIASHHGYGRPFAPVVQDDSPASIDLQAIGEAIALSSAERRDNPPHRLDSGVAERFWHLTRHFGWWGLAYLEAVLRLADQQASQRESETTSPKADKELLETSA